MKRFPSILSFIIFFIAFVYLFSLSILVFIVINSEFSINKKYELPILLIVLSIDLLVSIFITRANRRGFMPFSQKINPNYFIIIALSVFIILVFFIDILNKNKILSDGTNLIGALTSILIAIFAYYRWIFLRESHIFITLKGKYLFQSSTGIIYVPYKSKRLDIIINNYGNKSVTLTFKGFTHLQDLNHIKKHTKDWEEKLYNPFNQEKEIKINGNSRIKLFSIPIDIIRKKYKIVEGPKMAKSKNKYKDKIVNFFAIHPQIPMCVVFEDDYYKIYSEKMFFFNQHELIKKLDSKKSDFKNYN